MKRLFWHDSETTGVKFWEHQMLSYAMVCTDENLNILGQIYLKIKLLPHIIPSAEALKVNKIDPYGLEWAMEAVADSVAAETIHKFMNEFKGDENFLIAYNAQFDNGFLGECLFRNKLPLDLCFSFTSVDPLLISKEATGKEVILTPMKKSFRYGKSTEYRSNTLEDVSTTLGTQHQGDAHNALNDVLTLIKTAPEVYRRVANKPFSEALLETKYHVSFKKKDKAS